MYKTITQPPFIVDTLAELDPTWPVDSLAFCKATGGMYELSSGAWTANKMPYLNKPYDVTTSSGTSVIYLTKDGLSTGDPLFTSIDYVHIRFVSNDPNFGSSYAFTNSNKTLTITAVKQAFSGITVVGINVLGSVAISAAVNGTALKVLVQGVPA